MGILGNFGFSGKCEVLEFGKYGVSRRCEVGKFGKGGKFGEMERWDVGGQEGWVLEWMASWDIGELRGSESSDVGKVDRWVVRKLVSPQFGKKESCEAP